MNGTTGPASPAKVAGAPPWSSVAVASAGGNKITFSKTVSPALPPVIPAASTSVVVPPPPPPKRLAPDDAPLARIATRRTSSSESGTPKPSYREASSDSAGGVSDGDPPGYSGSGSAALAPSNGKGKLKLDRKYEELEDIIFSNPRSFTAMVFDIAEARGQTLFVSDDRTNKQSSAYMHITCAHRRSGCPFILKLTRAKEGGWLLKAALPQPGEADVKARSTYNCVHPPGSVPDSGPVLTAQRTAIPPKQLPAAIRAAHSPSPASVPSPSSGGTYTLPAFTLPAVTAQGKGKKKAPAPVKKPSITARRDSYVGSPLPFDQQIEPVYGKNVPSRDSRTASVHERSSMASPQVLGNMAKVKAPPIEDRALAPPFERSLSLQAKIQPVLSYERYNMPHESLGGLSASAQAFALSPAGVRPSPPPQFATREQPHGISTVQRPVTDSRSQYQVPPPAPSHSSPYSSAAISGHIQPPPPQQYATGPYQPSYRHILVPNPPSAPPAPRPSLLPVSSSLSAWTHFLKALDPTLLGFAAVLAAPTMALSPESFFAESLEMRLALIDVLEVEQVGVWPRLKLKTKVKERGEEVWKEVVEKETKRVEAKRAEQLAAAAKAAAEKVEAEKIEAEKVEVERAEAERHAVINKAQEEERREAQAVEEPTPMEGVEQPNAEPVAVEEVAMKDVTLVEAPSAPTPAPTTAPEPTAAPATVVEAQPQEIVTPSELPATKEATPAPIQPKPAAIAPKAAKSRSRKKKIKRSSKFVADDSPEPEPPSSASTPASSVPATAIQPLSFETPPAPSIATPHVAPVVAPSTSEKMTPTTPSSPKSEPMDISSDEEEVSLLQLLTKAKEQAAAKPQEVAAVDGELSEEALAVLVMDYLNTQAGIEQKFEGVRMLQEGWLHNMSIVERRVLRKHLVAVADAWKRHQAAEERTEEHKLSLRELLISLYKTEPIFTPSAARARNLGVLVLDEDPPSKATSAGEDDDTQTREGSSDDLLITRTPAAVAIEVPAPRAAPTSYAPPPPRPPSAGSTFVRSSVNGAPSKSGPPSAEDIKSAAAFALRPTQDRRASASPVLPPAAAPPAVAPPLVTAKRARSPTPPPVYPEVKNTFKPRLPPPSAPQESAGDKVRRELAARKAAPPSASSSTLPPKPTPRPSAVPRVPAGVPIPRPTGPPVSKSESESTPRRASTVGPPSSSSSSSTPRASYNPSEGGPDSSIRIKPSTSSSSYGKRFYGGEADDDYHGIPGLSGPSSRGGSVGAQSAGQQNGARSGAQGSGGAGRGGSPWSPVNGHSQEQFGGGGKSMRGD